MYPENYCIISRKTRKFQQKLLAMLAKPSPASVNRTTNIQPLHDTRKGQKSESPKISPTFSFSLMDLRTYCLCA